MRAGTLSRAVAERSRDAFASGALEPIETEEVVVEDGGVPFLVRRVSSLARKTATRAVAPRRASPFLPPEPELTVAEVSATHVAVLNKYPVRSEHLLLVTRSFVDQELLLDASDCAALAVALAEIDGLAFYNSGAGAGASQAHRHLQIVPVPLGRCGPPIPIERLLDAATGGGEPARVAALPFAHAFARVAPEAFAAREEAGAWLLDRYHALLAAAGLRAVASAGGPRASAPYNLLATRRWLLLVPRARESHAGVSINALGFAGSLFVRDGAELETLRSAGPMNVLRAVAGPVASLPR
jgi:ATP adenylyltransferase